MSLLKQVTTGKISQPFLGVVYGVDGVGKSTLGANAPSPIFLGTERGTYNLDVARLPAPKSFADILAAIEALTKEEHSYKTLVIDSLDWLEPLVWEQVVFDQESTKVKSIDDIGYNKGYDFALTHWGKILSRLTALRDSRGMHIVAIAHCMVKEAKDPSVTMDYNRFQLKLHHKAASLWREYVDCVLFANFETLVATDKQGKNRAFGDGARFLYTERRPAFDAKNRFGLPEKIELSWETLYTSIQSSNAQDPEALVRQIKALLEEAQNEKLAAQVTKLVEESMTDSLKLERILNKVRTVVVTAA